MTNRTISLKGFIILDKQGKLWSREIYSNKKEAIRKMMGNYDTEDFTEIILDVINNKINIIFADIEITYNVHQQIEEPTEEI